MHGRMSLICVLTWKNFETMSVTMINVNPFIGALGSASLDRVSGALSSAAVLRCGLGPLPPPLCRCAERATDPILQTWSVLNRFALTLLAAPALGLSGVATLRRRPKAGGQSRSQSAQVPGRTQVHMQ
jgi:hypothetical protein